VSSIVSDDLVAATTVSELSVRGPRSARGSDTRVAFQGERGAFSEEAALKLLGAEIELVPRPTFDGLFASIDEGLADFILAPLENSLAGSVHRSYDLLLASSLHIIGEVIIPIVHHLIGCPGSNFADIQTVESHPVALAQCERFFQEHPYLKRLAAEDTAGSAADIIQSGDRSRAAIAGRRAAEVYGGVIVQEHLEDHPQNYTRFVLLSPEPQTTHEGDKLSLVLKLRHRPAALHHALVPLARRGINLLKIESRPVPGTPWEYRFYLDLQASTEESKTMAALNELHACTEEVRVLGCYPSAAQLVGNFSDERTEKALAKGLGQS